MANTKVGIIGSGIVAQTLSKGFSKYGYDVMVGSRDVAKLKASGITTKTGSMEEAAQFGQLLVLTVKGTAALSLVKKLSPHLAGKAVIDTTNPIAEAPPDNGVLKCFTNMNESLMETLQQAAPEAHFVKAFSSVGSYLMVDPKLPGGKPSMFICGNDDGAKKQVRQVLDQFGWETEDMGKALAARAIEPLCMLWCIPGFLQNDWTHAFKVVRP
jgi:predicted dinucleotide-binding enzyme